MYKLLSVRLAMASLSLRFGEDFARHSFVTEIVVFPFFKEVSTLKTRVYTVFTDVSVNVSPLFCYG